MLLSDVGALAASTPEFIFEITVLASIFSMPCKIQSAVRGVISLTGVFLRTLGIIALPEIVDCLFRSHFLDAVGDAAESVPTFSLRLNIPMQ